MALGEIARFASLPEAVVATATLQACGLDAHLCDRHTGTTVWAWQQAMGGFRVVAPAEQLEEARTLVSAWRTAEPAALKWRRDPQVVSGLPLAILAMALQSLGTGGGWTVSLLRERFTATRLLVVLLCSGALGLLFLAVFFPSGD